MVHHAAMHAFTLEAESEPAADSRLLARLQAPVAIGSDFPQARPLLELDHTAPIDRADLILD